MANYIIVAGGDVDGTPTNTVEVITTSPAGGTVSTGPSLQEGVINFAMATAGQYTLVMGGMKSAPGSGSSESTDAVNVFKATDSGVEPVTGHGLTLSAPRYGLAAASCGKYILAMGGVSISTPSAGDEVRSAVGGLSSQTSYDTIDVFKVTDSGVETVTGHGLKLSVPRWGLATASCGKYIFAMGGMSMSTPSAEDEVRSVVGGISSQTSYDTIDVFKVTDSGVEPVTGHGLKLSVPRYSLAAASAGKYIMAMGGMSMSTPSAEDEVRSAVGGLSSLTYYDTIDVFKVTDSGFEKVTDHGLSLGYKAANVSAIGVKNYIVAAGGYSRISHTQEGVLYSNEHYDTVKLFQVSNDSIHEVTNHGQKLPYPAADVAMAESDDLIYTMSGYNINLPSGQFRTVTAFQVK